MIKDKDCRDWLLSHTNPLENEIAYWRSLVDSRTTMMWVAWFGWVVTAILFLIFNR